MLDLKQILTEPESSPEWLVTDFLYKGQMVLCAGEAGVGKSFFWYYLAFCIAAKMAFLGKQTAPGQTVLYFDEENSRPDLLQYLRWTWRGLEEPDISSLTSSLIVEHFELARQGRKRFEYMQNRVREVKPTLIIIDTATTALGVRDENDNAEASQILSKLRLIKETAGQQATLVILKHTLFAHDDTQKRTIRGAKTWLGEVDATYYHCAYPGRPRKDGLRNTYIEPDKVRAWGLKNRLEIFPVWIRPNLSLKLTTSGG